MKSERRKALEIVINMQFQNEPLMFEQSKKCALVAVDEIVKECSEWVGGDFSRWEQSRIDYWQEVKSEIERL